VRADLVLHVGDVARVGDVAGAVEVPQQAEQHVEHHHGPGVADVGEVVDRGPADVDAHVRGIERREDLLPAGQGVVDLKGHGSVLAG
jgi:hypothetical protein